MVWTFIFLMVILKIPIGLLAWIVWWAIHDVEELPAEESTDSGDDDGGIGRIKHPRGPKPRPARRGPHPGEPSAPAPARTRKPQPGRSRTTR